MSQRKIIEDLFKKNHRVTLRMMFDAGVGYTARNRISEMIKQGWIIEHSFHDPKKGETVSENSYTLISEPKYDSTGQGELVLI